MFRIDLFKKWCSYQPYPRAKDPNKKVNVGGY